MLRILKKYDFGFHWADKEGGAASADAVIPGRVMSFSSYPGLLYSGDDFTVGSSGLVSIETTIGNSNAKLWRHVRARGSVMEGVRATVANRLATNGRQWTRLFARFNSGTYNNQWMVIDYKRFKVGKALKKGLLWVLEQLPGGFPLRPSRMTSPLPPTGHIRREDLTRVLRSQSYWPSYNTPYFEDIYNMSGSAANAEK